MRTAPATLQKFDKERTIIGCLRGQGSFFPRTSEEAFGNGPAIVGYRRKRWYERAGGSWKANSETPPWGWPLTLSVAVGGFVLFFFVFPWIGHAVGL